VRPVRKKLENGDGNFGANYAEDKGISPNVISKSVSEKSIYGPEA
jgi:hypothetical protein